MARVQTLREGKLVVAEGVMGRQFRLEKHVAIPLTGKGEELIPAIKGQVTRN